MQVDEPTQRDDLTELLAHARRAGPVHRIEWRDRIAAHGRPAIEAVRPWLADSKYAAFAIRVIERVGRDGEREVAVEVLRGERRRVDAHIRPDVEWALVNLRATGGDNGEGDGAAERPAPARVPPRQSRTAAAAPTRRR
jgi:hypothetical protein